MSQLVHLVNEFGKPYWVRPRDVWGITLRDEDSFKVVGKFGKVRSKGDLVGDLTARLRSADPALIATTTSDFLSSGGEKIIEFFPADEVSELNPIGGYTSVHFDGKRTPIQSLTPVSELAVMIAEACPALLVVPDIAGVCHVIPASAVIAIHLSKALPEEGAILHYSRRGARSFPTPVDADALVGLVERAHMAAPRQIETTLWT